MLYGFAEETYREARSLGILFIRYEPDSSPEVSKEGEKVRVTIKSPDFKLPIEVDADLLVLSTPVVPEEHSILSELMKIPTDENGFFMEAHVKLRPLEFPTAGIFLAGMCHYPKLLDEAIAQGIGAAGRAKTILSKEFVLGGGAIASVDAKRCRGCGVCEEICQFGAITLRPDSSGRLQANVIEALCVGCGMCSVSCWSNAITMKNFSDEQIESMIVGALVKSKL
jgi:heterodisulfide reductase subunit A